MEIAARLASQQAPFTVISTTKKEVFREIIIRVFKNIAESVLLKN